MARPKNALPTYRLHKRSNTARSWVHGRWVELGPWNSPESRSEFARIVAEMVVSPAAAIAHHSTPTVNQLLAAFWQHAEQHYRHPDGSCTGELPQFRDTLKPVRSLYGHTVAEKFGPLALKAVRQSMIDGGLCRRIINQRIGRIKRMFKWAVSEQLLPVEIHQALATVTGLQVGRSKARESAPIASVPDELVEATLPHMNRHVRGLVEFQRLTGCRPGEACRVRRIDLETSGATWLYRPVGHKTAWRGKDRAIAVGPKAQAILREFFTSNPDEFLFSPRRMMDEFRAIQREQRKTSVQPSQRNRRKAEPELQPGERYTTRSYSQAVTTACNKAFALPPNLTRLVGSETPKKWRARLTTTERAEVKAWRKAHHWHPLQLRHSYATKTRRMFSLEHAGAALGHAKMSATEIYAERDAGLALEVATRIG